jgi:transposase-like protein
MVGEMLAARSIVVSHETGRQWALKFGQGFETWAEVAGARWAA